jgi:hypothetical protein
VVEKKESASFAAKDMPPLNQDAKKAPIWPIGALQASSYSLSCA